MPLFQNTSLRRKQTLIIMLTCAAALFLACAVFVTDDVLNFRNGLIKKLSVLAEAIGNNCTATIEYNDPGTAEETLKALRAESSIVAAGLYTRNGQVFALYRRPGVKAFSLPPVQPHGHVFKEDYLFLFRPIEQQGEVIGTIVVASDLSELKQRLGRYPLIVGSMVAAALLVAFLLSSRLQRLVSGPILHLAALTRSVAEEKNYSLRATKQTNDEIGQLIEGFNEMLAQIQTRDAALRAAHDLLENRVQERTEELRQSQVLYHSLVEHLPVQVYRKNLSGHFEFVNSLFCRMHAKTPDQILGKKLSEVIDDKEMAERHEKIERRIIGTGESIETEEETRDATGNVKHFQIITSPVFGPGGEVTGTQGMLVDITERKQTAAKLEEIHRELIAVSRQAGMAEVATSVLHNVGNVLNSVNISASVIFDKLKSSRLSYLGRLAGLFQEHTGDLGEFLTQTQQGKQIPQYLTTLSQHLDNEQQSMLKEADALRKHIEHIKNVVSMQQSYAKVAGVTEVVKVQELVEDALRLNASSLGRHNVHIRRDFAPGLPEITVDKHKVLQILVNLIRNAQRACDQSKKEDKVITVSVRSGGHSLVITVSDNGIGIPAENLTRIFNHGFTTKKDGHGFGLHSGALAAKEMGGALTAQSDGPDQGANVQPQAASAPQEQHQRRESGQRC